MTNARFCDRIALVRFGGVAHLGERSVRNAEVEGSIPFVSTITETSFVSRATEVSLYNMTDPVDQDLKENRKYP